MKTATGKVRNGEGSGVTNGQKRPRASTLFYESDWRHVASSPIEGTENTLDIYAKNGRMVLVEEFGPDGEHGFEVFYPSKQRTITDTIAEANAYAMFATITIPGDKEG